MPSTPHVFPVGDRLPGTKYVVVKALGHGGMGSVHQVVKEPGIKAVVKIIHPHLAKRAEFRKRFFDEVRILAQLHHPNIVNVIDYDTLADGTPFYAMELLKGRSLRQLLRAVGTLQPGEAYEIMHQLLEGLYCAHTFEPCVVHRDVKADNIFLHAPTHGQPCVKVIDFGVAQHGGIDDDEAFLGTPKYAAPEQLRGEKVTPRADLYAAALVLYEMLAGRGPFDHLGDNDRIVRAHLRERPPPIRQFASGVPESVEQLIAAALDKDPEKRPRDAYAFAAKLWELQITGTRRGLDVNTTSPTLSTMITAANTSPSAELPVMSGTATDERMTPPPVDGRTLEDAPPSFHEQPTVGEQIASTPLHRERTRARTHDGLTQPTKGGTQPMLVQAPRAEHEAETSAARAVTGSTASEASEAPSRRAPSAISARLAAVPVESETGVARSVPLRVAPSAMLTRRSRVLAAVTAAASILLIVGGTVTLVRQNEQLVSTCVAAVGSNAIAIVPTATAVAPPVTNAPTAPAQLASASPAASATTSPAVRPVLAPIPRPTVNQSAPPKDDGVNLLFDKP